MSGPEPYAGSTRYTRLEYEAVLANASIGIAFTRERKFFLCNPRFAEMFGWTPDELIGQPGEVVYPTPESYAALGQIAVPVLTSGRQLDIEWEMRRRDGLTMLCRVIAKAIDPKNTAQGTVWIAEDITERKRHADEVERLLREQQAILDTATFGIVFMREQRIVRCNRRYEELYGYGAGELAGTPGADLFTDAHEHAAFGEAFARMPAGRSFSSTGERRKKDGSTFWIRAEGRAIDPLDPHKGSVWSVEDITAQRSIDEENRRLASEQQALLDNVVVGIAFVRARRVARCNRRFETLFGYAAGEAVGLSTRQFYFTDEAAVQAESAYVELDRGGTHQREQYLRRADGSGFWCRISGRALEPGDPARGTVWLFEDVSARRAAEERVRSALAEQALILDNATIGIAFVRGRVLQRCNARMEEMFGYARGALNGLGKRVLYPDEASFEAVGQAYGELADGGAHTEERMLRRADGSTFRCRMVGRAIDPAHPEGGAIWIFEDVTAAHAARSVLEASRDALERAVEARTAELKAANEALAAQVDERGKAEARARHLAGHDALTGLPNRRVLEDRLDQAIRLSRRNRRQSAAVFLDLDRFKKINDTLGHAVGDEVLKEVAARLAEDRREGDTICRLGGDEFVIVLPEIRQASDAAYVAEKLLLRLSLPMTIDGREITVTPSIGIAVWPEDGADAAALIRCADAAMYHVKNSGRAAYQFFTASMQQSATERMTLETELREAVRNGQLRLAVQPVLELAGGALAGHEVLVRWQHPVRGLLMPAGFLPIAEDSGLLLEVGAWILGAACRWAATEPAAAGLPVAVSLSARQLNDPKLVDAVAQALADAGLPASRLELAITEAATLEPSGAAHASMQRLAALGVGATIDDIGTSASSLAALGRAPVRKLKIDCGAIAQLPRGTDGKAVLAGAIALAHALGLRVVAEGVESEAQRDWLKAAGCDYVQGFAHPAPAAAPAAAGLSAG